MSYLSDIKTEQNFFYGEINQGASPEFLSRLAKACATVFGHKSKVLLCISDKQENMMIKFSLLAGLIAGGAEAYNLLEAGDRSIAKFSMRKLELSGGISGRTEGNKLTIEILDKNGLSASRKTMDEILEIMNSGRFFHPALKELITPINVSHMPLIYFKEIVSTTVCKRLNFSVGVCTQASETKEILKKIGTAFGILFIFTNDATLLPELISENHLDFGLLIGENGKFGFIDDNSKIISGEMFYSLISLMLFSADNRATILIPDHRTETVAPLADICHGSLSGVPEECLEEKLIKKRSVMARLEHDLLFDPIRSLLRLCEFLYINNCRLSQVLRLLTESMPVKET